MFRQRVFDCARYGSYFQLVMASNAFFALRALAIPVLAAAIAFFEIQRPLGPFRLFTMVCVSLLLADATSLLRGRLRDVLLVITSFVSGLSGIEASVSWSAPENLLVNTPGLSVPQPVIGWGPRHSGRFHARKIDPRTGTVVYDVEYTIDQNLCVRQIPARPVQPSPFSAIP